MESGVCKLIIICVLSLIFVSCNNDDEDLSQRINGTYSGTFTVEYLNGDTFTNPVTIEFTGVNNYQSSGSSDYFPAGGNGSYERSNSTIDFYDENYWTANFDWNLILSGEYDYLISDNELIISANRSDLGIYKYELTKE